MKPGDVVILKSGGEFMTIASLARAGEEPGAWCVWHEGKKPQRQLYPLVVLQRCEEGRSLAAILGRGEPVERRSRA